MERYLDLVNAAAGGEVDGAGVAGAINLGVGKGEVRASEIGAGGLGLWLRCAEPERARGEACAVGKVRRTYVDGEAGGLEAARRGVGEQGRRDGRLPQATRRQHRRQPVSSLLLRLLLSARVLSAHGWMSVTRLR